MRTFVDEDEAARAAHYPRAKLVKLLASFYTEDSLVNLRNDSLVQLLAEMRNLDLTEAAAQGAGQGGAVVARGGRAVRAASAQHSRQERRRGAPRA